jgi:hypothetical protein
MNSGIAQIITLLACLVTFGLFLFAVWQTRRETRLTLPAPLIAIGMTALTTLLYVWLSGATVNTITAGVLLIPGLLIGSLEGQAARVYYRGNTIVGKRRVASLVLWGLAYLVTVLLAQFGSALLHAIGILGMVFGVGVSVGSNTILFIRHLTLRPLRSAGALYPTKPASLPR